ncbi:restriction endonuclease subunit S [Actibacterium lipolyticum]|uniref:Putative type-1 restriction enzyme specificity protein MG438 n=1 Tax=Actibacterium lipolyticum TaxID=1524263 RepID=A0A238JUR8_9RHOB|nr:restriction endonuclease subunit S [Actibacterium lipolyticum]SMX34409.1 Putative type-1 restriction enzyme specificity protein MG438 [Actibacterium lipolyticum]
MNEIVHTFPLSVQPGIPKIGQTPEGWTRTRLGKLFEVVSRPVKMLDHAEYDLITVKRSRGGIERRARMKGREISVKSQFEIREGDFVISKRQIVHGACAIVPAEFSGSIVSNEYSVLRCRPVLDPEYLRWLVHAIYVQQTFFHSSIGVHVEKMIFKLDEWFRWKIDLPPLAEQQRRAGSLNALHTRLEGLRREKALLSEYKTGLMQKIFSQDIRFRADDGSAFPDWQTTRLGRICQMKAGQFLQAAEISDENTDTNFPCYGGNGLRGFSLKFNKNGQFPLIGRQGALCGNVHFAEGQFYATEHAIVAEPADNVVAKWLFYKLVDMRLVQFATGLAQPGLAVDTLAYLKLQVPHPDEQRKIADALGAIDAKINSVAAQIEKLDAFRQGLLQKMFV